MTLKMIHFFEDEDDGLGWSEVWYIGGSDFTAGMDAAVDWANQRAKILSPDTTITYARIVGNLPADNAARARQQRNATLKRLLVTGTANAGGGRDGDLPWTAIKTRWQSNDKSVFRTQLIRGVPDNWFDKGSDKRAQAEMQNWLPGALGRILGNNMLIRHLNPPVPPATVRLYSYIAPASAQYEGYTRRATGRPFGLPRGRRPNRT